MEVEVKEVCKFANNSFWKDAIYLHSIYCALTTADRYDTVRHWGSWFYFVNMILSLNEVTQYFRNLQLSCAHIDNKLSFNAVYYSTTIRIDNKTSICTKDRMSPTTTLLSYLDKGLQC